MSGSGVATPLAAWTLHAGAPAAGRAQQPLVDVRVLPSDTLRDVALTVIERGRPTIYYSTR